MQLFKSEKFLVAKSSEVPIEWVSDLTHVLGVQWHWELVLLGVLAMESRQLRGCHLLSLTVLDLKSMRAFVKTYL